MSESFEYDKPLNNGTTSVTTPGSVGGGGMTSASSDSNTMSEVQETTHMLQRDHKVRRIRIITIVVLCVAAASVCGGVYSGLKRSEQREFENRFADQAQQIGHTLETELDNKLRAIDALSVTITSFALSQQTTKGTQAWPNVTVPEFPYRAASTLSVGRAISVALQPMVAADQISEWEAYSIRRQQWQNEVLAFQAKFPEAIRPDEDSADGATISTVSEEETRVFTDVSAESISDFVFQIDNDMIPIRGAITENRVALPLWQHAPVHSDGQLPRTNFDTYSVEKNTAALDLVMQNHLAVLGQAFELSESSQG